VKDLSTSFSARESNGVLNTARISRVDLDSRKSIGDWWNKMSGASSRIVWVLPLLCLSGCINTPPLYELWVEENLVVDESETGQKRLLVTREECDIAFLRKYSQSRHVPVRVMVALNPGADAQLFEMLSRDDSDRVRGALAQSPYTPRSVLLELLLDCSDIVRANIVMNGNLTGEEIRALWERAKPDRPHPDRIASVLFAMNPRLPADVRRELELMDDEAVNRRLKLTDERRAGTAVRESGADPEPEAPSRP
jgi:hypothetical protein